MGDAPSISEPVAPKAETPGAETITPVPHFTGLTLDERYNLCRSVGEECIQEEELRRLLEKKPEPACYDGFEPSGRMHIAQGILKSINVNKLTKAGCKFIFWVADWFALMNNKMGGDIKKIQTVWKACGMDLSRVEFKWTSEEIRDHPLEYWERVIDVARTFNLPRIIRCSQIMGRSDTDDLSAAQLMYPCMQCADIFYLKADICQLGMDQRKVNMLAREYCDAKKIKFKPVILSHHMMSGLLEGQEKMSKSDPESAIFMEDTEADVARKIKRAFCPPTRVEGNPCLDYMKHVVIPSLGAVTVERKPENGGNKVYTTYEELETDFVAGALHPGDLKDCLTKGLNRLIQPVRDHFENNAEAKELLKRVKGYKTTK